MHEIGHSLGLGHSPYETDIMYTPHKYGVVDLSDNDAFSVQCLYSLPAGKSVRDIGAQYSVMTDNDIDLVIRQLDEKYAQEYAESGNQTDGEKTVTEKYSIKKERNLLDETANIGELRKYNLMIQNVGLSNSIDKFFRAQHRDKK